MAINVVLAKAHQQQLSDGDIKKELDSVASEINRVDLSYADGTVNFVFVKGLYDHNERKMITVALFVNKTHSSISEIHGVLKMKYKNQFAKIAKATINFDEPFMGTLKHDEALLVHIGIPVKGLTGDMSFKISDIIGSFEDVRVTMC